MARRLQGEFNVESGEILKAVIYFTAHLCTGIIHECYKLLVYPLSKINEY